MFQPNNLNTMHFYLSIVTYVLGAEKNRLIETVLFEYPQHVVEICERYLNHLNNVMLYLFF